MKIKLGSFVVLFILSAEILTAQSTIPTKLQKTAGLDIVAASDSLYGLMNVNNFTYWLKRDGVGGMSPSGREGALFPRGTGHVLYKDGFIFGGKVFLDAQRTLPAVSQPMRVGGTHYVPGTTVGWIDGTGSSAQPADTTDSSVRIYRIRRDYFSMSTDELRKDAAEVKEISESEVTQAQLDEVRNRYAADWNDWPVSRGAPYIERNGTPGYQAPPAFSSTFTVDSLIAGHYDEPGIGGSSGEIPASQVLWTVFNDLDSSKTMNVFVSLPLGLEIQITAWAYDRLDNLGNVVFKRYRMINKGGVDTSNGMKGSFWIDSMYVAAWSDGDLGSFSDDLAGCDTTLGLGFYWNGNASDRIFSQFALPPPSFGIGLLEGPQVTSPSDSAAFGFRMVSGLKNILATSFIPFGSGMPYSEPANGVGITYEGMAGQWWKMLRGFVPVGTLNDPDWYFSSGPFSPSKFVYWGDPVTGTGWIDGVGTNYSFVPGDRREALSSGPFSMAPGDTQEVIFAYAGGMGADYVSSIAAMKSVVRSARRMNEAQFNLPAVPSVNAAVTYPSPATATLMISAHAHAGTESGMHLGIYRPDSSFVGDLILYDDGLHGDGSALDNVFGNSLTVNRDSVFLFADLTVFYGADSLRFARVLDHIFTAGNVNVSNPAIFDDDGNSDGKASPGELVRYGMTVTNNSFLDLPSVKVIPSPSSESIKEISFGSMASGADSSITYNANDPSTYFSVRIPVAVSDTVFKIPMNIISGYFQWVDTLNVAVILTAPEHVVISMLHHMTGKADGGPGIRITDTTLVKNHRYTIVGVDSVDMYNVPFPRLMIRDETLNTVIESNIPFPDSLGFSEPVVDGFKVLQGTLIEPSRAGMKDWSVPSGVRVWDWENAMDLYLGGFNGAIGWASPRSRYYDGVNVVRGDQLTNVLIKFAATDSAGTVIDGNDPNWSYGYRYLRNASQPAAEPEFSPYILNSGSGYAFQAFGRNVPFSAWDVESDPPQRLAIGFLENNVTGGMVDGKYWPPYHEAASNTNTEGPREWFFIFAAPYSETANPAYETDMISGSQPIMWFGTPSRLNNTGFSSSDQFLIEAAHIITSNDSWGFNPTVTGVEKNELPLQFSLSNNFPNPFNPATRVEFQVPAFGKVSVKVYDLLGRVVATLVDGERAPGTYEIRWDASTMPSGVYFCRMNSGSFVAVRKMVLIK